jgi:hypothetical protein
VGETTAKSGVGQEAPGPFVWPGGSQLYANGNYGFVYHLNQGGEQIGDKQKLKIYSPTFGANGTLASVRILSRMGSEVPEVGRSGSCLWELT